MNDQNLPKDEIRSLFVARPDHTLFFLDYSQIELRVGASYIQDKMWLEGYKDPNYDIHKQTSEVIFGRPHKDDTERKFAKNFNFGMLYGAGVPRIAGMLKELFGGTLESHKPKAKVMVDAFRRAHPNLKKFEGYAFQRLLSDQILYEERPWTNKRNVEFRGYLTNRYGRRYCLPPCIIYKWLEYMTSGDAAGDMLKLKFVDVGNYLIREVLSTGIKCNIVRLTHDEIGIEVPDCSSQAGIVEACKDIMEEVPVLKDKVPIAVDVEYSKDCLNLKEWRGTNDLIRKD